jgi:hypothetical protein
MSNRKFGKGPLGFEVSIIPLSAMQLLSGCLVAIGTLTAMFLSVRSQVSSRYDNDTNANQNQIQESYTEFTMLAVYIII